MSLLDNFPERIEFFIKAANKHHLEMILVGGGAVNFHGFQRHSADLDFWIDIHEKNLKNLLSTFSELNYNLGDIPDKVKRGEQNISIKISPVFELEIITNFNPGKSFYEALKESELVEKEEFHYNVLSFNDLIQSKISSTRLKDKLDVEELHRIKLNKNK
ncbi:MAG: hypothetical protein KAH68_03715 [Draconibacterium sp.]|nr:hypothetical protein [Draconibacterium sp.]